MEEFNKRIMSLPDLHSMLMDNPLIPVIQATKKKNLPENGGVYVFYEETKALYVGRTRNLKRRVRIHTSSDEMGSNFALKIAKENAIKSGIDISSAKNKKALMQIPEFRELFVDAKQRIKKMSVRVYTVEDPITQHLMEVYTHLALGTFQYNDFDTH